MSVNGIDLDDVPKIVGRPMQKGEAWYLVDKAWYEQFEKFISIKEPSLNPGPIDNGKLFANNLCELKDNLQDEFDYKLMPEEAWKMVAGYFGIENEKHEIRRWVIEEGNSVTMCVVEIYLTELKLCLYDRPTKFTKSYSRSTKLYDLEEDMKILFDIDSSRETRINHLNTVLDIGDDKTLADASISSDDVVLLEVMNKLGTWPSDQARNRTITTRSSAGIRSHIPGVCGLTNLGNTCFMNSALQCLSNTPPLTEFITSDRYLNQINRDNPLGMEGRIAEAYGDMIKNIWAGSMECFVPRQFKYVVGSFAPQFSGYMQQDCQELMAFLLDGLHEDFNRITKKPYIEVKTDVDQRPNHIVAQESWENYKKRNDSIIVDTFHGLLKSTLVCPDCELISVTFDPFCYLSLPLPMKREKQIDVTFVPAVAAGNPDDSNGNKDMETEIAFTFIGLSVPKYGSVSDISSALVKVLDREKIVDHQIDPSKLIVAKVFNHRIQKIFKPDELIGNNTNELVIYELPDDEQSIPVYLREVHPNGEKVLFGRPFYISVNNQHYDTIHQTVASHLQNYRPLNDSTNSEEGECQNGAEFFSLSLTNSMASVDFEKLDQSKSIELNGNSFLAADLPTEAKEKYYNPKRERPLKVSIHKTSQQKSNIQLSECIKNFTTTEKLGEDDSWYCPTCKKHQQATKKFDLWELPNVLIIHLKRFSYSRYWRDKIDTLVDFPITGLDMGMYVINNPDKKPIIYDLIAVICFVKIVFCKFDTDDKMYLILRSQTIMGVLVVVIILPAQKIVLRISGTTSTIPVRIRSRKRKSYRSKDMFCTI